jgi:hypothetical protein
MKCFQLIALYFAMITMTISLQHVAAISEQNNFIPSNDVWKTSVGKQIQLVADITNKQDIKQPFVYLVQVQDNEGKVVLLTWISGSLQPHQSLSPEQSSIPTKPGVYTAQIFDWYTLLTWVLYLSPENEYCCNLILVLKMKTLHFVMFSVYFTNCILEFLKFMKEPYSFFSDHKNIVSFVPNRLYDICIN